MSKNTLSEKDLNKVTGGAIKEEGYRVLERNYIMLGKEKGWDRDTTVEYFKDCWFRNCNFKVNFTDGTSEDFYAAISWLQDNYDKD